MINPVSTIGAFASSGVDTTSMERATIAQRPDTSVPASSFASFVMDATSHLQISMANAESAAIRGFEGKATAYEVATSINEAEQALKMATSIRDKVVSAYLEISRMQI